jgi:tetratricopeptide (TPR) repeat protein
MARLSDQARSLKQVIDERSQYSNTREWLEKLLAVLRGDPRLRDDSLSFLEHELRGGYGWEYTKIQEEYEEHITFWRSLAQQFNDQPRLLGILADTLLLAGHRDEALDQFLEAFRQDPNQVYKFGGELHDFYLEKGGEYWLEYQLVLVRAALKTGNEDYAKEVYRRLLDEYRNDGAAMKKILHVAGGRL